MEKTHFCQTYMQKKYKFVQFAQSELLDKNSVLPYYIIKRSVNI